jgi:CRISPR-associated protein Cas1
MPIDYHELPQLRDSLTYCYIEHALIDRKDSAIEYIQQDGRVMVPIASLCTLMLGPGTSITHAAVKALADNGCTVLWVGEDITRCYAQGLGETRKAYHLLRQAERLCDPGSREKVVLNMYQYRFPGEMSAGMSLVQLRGMEGARVKAAYAAVAKKYGVHWSGRNYNRGDWNDADPVNRALSAANALLNGICHAAILSGGYSPALGFIHTGRQLSFVYDIADLYKAEFTIPAAFQAASETLKGVEKRARELCRERFREGKILQRILPDIDHLLEIDEPSEGEMGEDPPSELWEELY